MNADPKTIAKKIVDLHRKTASRIPRDRERFEKYTANHALELAVAYLAMTTPQTERTDREQVA